MSYATEKLGLAIYKLTVGEEDIKERLRSVFKYLSPLEKDDFPKHLREKWISIIKRLTSKSSNIEGTKYDEGKFEATLYGMRKKIASKIAQDILELYEDLIAAEK